jgi:two-component system, NarL family, nitrate/nitrite response regulator NarL
MVPRKTIKFEVLVWSRHLVKAGAKMNIATTPEGKTKKRVLIADDHEMLLDVFSIYLSNAGDYQVSTVKTFDDAVVLLQGEEKFDVVLLDWNMPGMHGINGLKRALQICDSKPVGIITGDPSPKMIDEAVSSGAAAVILKSSGVRTLLNALNVVCSGDRYLPFELIMNRQTVKEDGSDKLTPRELLILRDLARGKRNKEICHEHKLAMPTVKMHVSAILRKLSASNRLHAIVLARDLGLV